MTFAIFPGVRGLATKINKNKTLGNFVSLGKIQLSYTNFVVKKPKVHEFLKKKHSYKIWQVLVFATQKVLLKWGNLQILYCGISKTKSCAILVPCKKLGWKIREVFCSRILCENKKWCCWNQANISQIFTASKKKSASYLFHSTYGKKGLVKNSEFWRRKKGLVENSTSSNNSKIRHFSGILKYLPNKWGCYLNDFNAYVLEVKLKLQYKFSIDPHQI